MSAISLHDDSTITIGAGTSPASQTTLVQTTTSGSAAPSSHYLNPADTSKQGGYNTIEINSGSTVTIGANATVRASGNSGKNEAINVFGDGNHIVNYGFLIADPGSGSAIFFQNWYDDAAGNASNNVDNYGTIQAQEAIGSSGNIDVNFINRTGATVNGNLNFQGGNDSVTLETGSTITGNLNGGSGSNSLVLDASQGTQDAMPGQVQNFETLTKTGAGTWTLTGTIGNNTASGSNPLAVYVLAGTLSLEGDNTNFNGTVVVNPAFTGSTAPGSNPDATLQARAQSLPPLVIDHGIVVFNQVAAPGGGSLDGTYAGVIQGEGSVTKDGPGTTVLVGANTYAGTTTISEGTLQLGNGGSSGSIGPGDVTDNGVLAFDRSDTFTFANAVAGTGAVVQQGTGTTILTADNAWSGGTTINTGTLQLGNGGNAGGLTGDVTNNGALVFDRADTYTLGGVISGTGAVVQQGTGTTVLTADNTWTGGTTINAGTLQLGNGGNAGGLTGDVTNNGTLVFDRADTYTFGGVISGTGAVVQQGTGTTVLTADGTWTGGTTINAGTLQLGNGGTSGSLTGDVVDNGTLAFDRTDTVTYGDVVSGAGGLDQRGVGTTVLTGENTYTGATTVEQGVLAVGDASHLAASLSGGGDVAVASAATLGGYGTVAGNVSNQGTIAVANALPAFSSGPNGSFTLGGNLTNAGNLNLAGATPGNVLRVGGNYDALPGATLTVKTLVNEGGPLANQATDRLLIMGDPPGTTIVHVIPTAGSPGGYTAQNNLIRSSDGISLVQVAGASTPDAFELPTGYLMLSSQPYVYRLYAYGPGSIHGTADPSQSLVGNPGGHWDYRLQTGYETPKGPVDPDEPGGAVPGPPPEPGEEPIEGPGGEEAFPIPPDARVEVAPQVASYLSMPAALLYAGTVDLDTLHRRLGEIRDQGPDGAGGDGEMFMRVYGGDFHYASNISFQNFGYNTSGSYAAIQLGGNLFKVEGDKGIWRLGLAGSLGSLAFDPEAVDGPSSSQTDIYRLSGYATYQSAQGWYVDNILSMGWFNDTVDTTAHGQVLRGSGKDYAASVEAGYPFALPDNFHIEPQLQLIGQRVAFHDAVDADGLDVNMGSHNQLSGRLGARITRPFGTQNGQLTPYAGIDYLHGFQRGGDVRIGGVNFAAGELGDAVQYSLGINGTENGRLTVYARASYQQRVGTGGFDGWIVNAGLRYVF